MTIWILAVLLLASLAGVGYNQGAVRVACSLVGLVVAAVLAIPLGAPLKPLLPHLGVNNPLLISALAPFAVFLITLIIFKVVGLAVHRKVDVYYKYKAGDLRMALWQRLNARLGLCLGLANAAVYLVLISVVIYGMSYWTVQMATADVDPTPVRLLNKAGRDLQATGLSKVARAIDPLPDAYYQAADIVGLIYHNPLLHARLSRYPALLALGERPEFQDIASDNSYLEMLQRRTPIGEVLHHAKTQAILERAQLLRDIWGTLGDELKDLRAFLETGRSAKYDGEPILGRWYFDVNGAVAMLKRLRPTITSGQLRLLRQTVFIHLTKTTFIAAPDQQAILKNVIRYRPGANPATSLESQTLKGQWTRAGERYELSFGGGDELEAVVEGDRLTISGDWMALVFVREE